MKVTANIPEYSGGPQTVAVELPSDKSISHRVIFFGAMAQGMSTIHRVSSSQDCLATKTAMESFGVRFSAINEQRNFASEADYQSFTVQSPGVFAWRSPSEAIDAGNSGTTARLLFGIASGVPGLLVKIIGDESLSARPMGRVVAPLTACGAEIRLDGERLPAFITGKSLRGFNVRSDVVSAQVKSALLLASICATGESVINVAAGTRNHTEQMLRFLGAPLGQMDQESSSDGRDVFHVRGPWQVPPLECTVPGDPSAMAFFAALAFLHPGLKIRCDNVLGNPGRLNFLEVFQRSGLTVTRSSSSARQSLGEDHLDFEMVREGRALQMTVLAHEVPSLIDEIPALAVAATACPGVSEFCGLGELRVKESDRLYEIHQLLSGAGVETSIKHDNLSVAGQRSVRGFNYHSEDHRLVMAAMILATSAKKMSTISPTSAVKVSFPSFFEQLAQIYR